MKIALGCDHTGYCIKPEIISHLEKKGFEVADMGATSPESTDYPIYGEKVGRAVASGEYDFGVIFCGTGIGISLAANKVRGVRAAVCSEPLSARLSREHNNANIISFGARVVGVEMAKMILDEFFAAEFQGGRHQRRVDLIMAVEKDAK